MVGDDLAPHLQAALPGALVLSDGGRREGWPEPARVVRWDGRAAPLAAGSAGLVVVDARRYDLADAEELVVPGGAVAALGPEGDHLVYPGTEAPELVWRRSWPVTVLGGPVPWLRRRVGLAVGRGDAVPRLRVSGDLPTLADDVLAELRRETGLECRLVGVMTGGHVVLRV